MYKVEIVMKLKNNNNESEEYSFWQSYSDLMAALLLMFVLIMSGILLNYNESIKEEQNKNKQLEDQKILLEEQQKSIEEQKKSIEDQKLAIEEQQKQIDKLIGIKEEIIKNLSKTFEESDLVIAVDQYTGSIVFDSNILFATDSFELSPEGEASLGLFVPLYFKSLLTGKYKEYISEIIIEGHTDVKGSYMYNLELSQKRAFSVCEYCLEKVDLKSYAPELNIDNIRKILTANGRSWSNPVYKDEACTVVDMDSSRRVEFKFRLKDDEMINQMKDILEK
ncbi:MAG: OmpA family protein [Oscillospiraceae bacterium]|nr:OmpA family protein [Oscillospiraceae bacterium]